MSSASKPERTDEAEIDPLTYKMNNQLRWEICWMAKVDPEDRFNEPGSNNPLLLRQLRPVAEILAPDVESEDFGLYEIQNLISHAIGSGERYTKTKPQFNRESLKTIHRELSRRVE